MTGFYIIAFMAWWSIAYPLTHRASEQYDCWKDGLLFVAAILWPITIVFFTPLLFVHLVTESAREIRIRLRNRGLLRDFEKWLDSRDRGDA